VDGLGAPGGVARAARDASAPLRDSLRNTRKGATQRQALWTLGRAAVAVQPEPPALGQTAHEEKEG